MAPTESNDSNAETDGKPGRTMADISHTNPYTGETAGQLFSRGPTVIADGGTPAATDPDDATTSDATETMRDVDHTPPKGADDANRVFERGRNYPVEEEE